MDDEDDIRRVMDLLDGMLFIGGADLDCRRDGYMLHPSMRLLDPRREDFDRRLMGLVVERRMPVMGVGCGMQLLNVSMGGTLFLHIAEDLPQAIPHLDAMDPNHRHALEIEMGTIMERVYGEGEIRVNSMHHMAIDDVAPGFAITARCPDGVVEAIESTMDDWFAFGTQFHPESESASALDLRIFEEFVAGITGEVVEMRMVALRKATPMSTSPRLEIAHAGDVRRWIAGVLVSSRCDRAAAALVGVRGRGLAAETDIVGTISRDLPRETAALFDALSERACHCWSVWQCGRYCWTSQQWHTLFQSGRVALCAADAIGRARGRRGVGIAGLARHCSGASSGRGSPGSRAVGVGPWRAGGLSRPLRSGPIGRSHGDQRDRRLPCPRLGRRRPGRSRWRFGRVVVAPRPV